MAELNIPDEARKRAVSGVYGEDVTGKQVDEILALGAPLIVAAELERLADELKAEENSHVMWRAISRRARDLRGVEGGQGNGA